MSPSLLAGTQLAARFAQAGATLDWQLCFGDWGTGYGLKLEGGLATPTWYFLSSASPPANTLVPASEASRPKFSVNRPPWLLISDSSLLTKCLGAGLAPFTTGLTSKSFPLPVTPPITSRMTLLTAAGLDSGGGGAARFDGVSCTSSTGICSGESFLFF